jgi:predicted DNA-binding protein with PD1-like motif
MRSKRLSHHPGTFVLILDAGDELHSSLTRFAQQNHLAGSSFKAIGASSAVELGWFDWENKEYRTSVNLSEQVELLSLIGDIALKGNQPQVHAHVVIRGRDGIHRYPVKTRQPSLPIEKPPATTVC